MLYFMICWAIGNTTAIRTVLIAAVGKTIAKNNPRKLVPGGKEIKSASDVRNTVPLKTVPSAVKTRALTYFGMTLRISEKIPKITEAVMSLSMTFGKNPPGIVVVSPERSPATRPMTRKFLRSLNRKIARNIIDNKRSGFIGKLGTTACKTVPMAINKAIKINFKT